MGQTIVIREIASMCPLWHMENEFRTRDLYWAAFVIEQGIQLLRTEKTGKQVVFVFPASPEIEKLKVAWVSHTGTTDPLNYANSIKSLKALIAEMMWGA